MGSYGIVDVDAWEDIGAGVCFVEGSYGCAENVLVRVDDRAEVGTVVEEGTDDQAQGHAGKQECTHFVVVFFAAEQEENQCLPKHPRLQCRRSPHCHQQKPDLSKISLPAVRITASHHFHLSGNHVFKTTLHHRCMRCLPDGLCHPLLSIRIRNRHRRQEDNRKSAWLKHQAPFYFIFLR